MSRNVFPPFHIASVLLLVAGILVACGSTSVLPSTGTPTSTTSQVTPTGTGTPTPTPLPPSPYRTATEFLNAWSEGRYDSMYRLLSTKSQAAITEEKFAKRYQAIAEEATIAAVEAEIEPGIDQMSPIITYTVSISTTDVGAIVEENAIPLVQEGDDWKVIWEPKLIFKRLWGDSLIHMFHYVPERGSIYDRNGQPLATQDQIYSVGVVPGRIKDEPALLAALSETLKLEPEVIKERYTTNAQPDWFMPVADLPLNTSQDVVDRLEAIDGVMTQRKPIRVYPNGSLAAQVIGYIGEVTAEELEELGPKGYKAGDIIGKTGLEAWGEPYLAGKKGAKLAVVAPEGTIQSVIAERPGSPAQDIYLTLDLTVQKAAEDALGDNRGTVVALDPTNGSILAMASHPTYDPNAFIRGITAEEWKQISEDLGTPMNNKAIGSAYPPGSTFKVITMAAGLEKGGFNRDSAFFCQGRWAGLGGSQVWDDWKKGGHGNLNLFQGLVQSCNIVFYEIGKKLDGIDQDLLPSFAGNFGLGKPTGITGLYEATGVLPDPKWKEDAVGDIWYSGDTVNLSIGQGYLLVTPLQMTNVYNAIASGGKLYRPFLVERVQSAEGEVVLSNQPEVVGQLPVSPQNLALIQEAMRSVVGSSTGTARSAFEGFPIPVAGKTGTAQHGTKDTHAWFISYGPAESPTITVGVLVEDGGEGSVVSAPIARKVYEAVLAK